MISLFYKLRLLSYVLSSLKDVVAKLLFFTVYLYVSSIILMFLSHGFSYAVEFSSPGNAFSQLYLYLKWCYDHRNNLDYGISFRILVAIFTPNFLYKLLLSVNWRPLFRKVIIRTVKFFRRKNDENTHQENTYKTEDIYERNTVERDYEHDVKLVNNLKYFLIQDIEKVIDKRLYDIFLARRKKKSVILLLLCVAY